MKPAAVQNPNLTQQQEEMMADHQNQQQVVNGGASTRARLVQRLMLAVIGRIQEQGEAEHYMERHGVDLDNLSYEELLVIGEVVGTVSKGVSAETVASLASVVYAHGVVNDTMCVICQLDFEAGDKLNLLACKHSYHSKCLGDWLRNNKVCPVCSAEVSHAAAAK